MPFKKWMDTEPPNMNTPACWRWSPPTEATMRRASKMLLPDHWARSDETEHRRILMIEWQHDRCGMCGLRWPRQVIDHDHETGLIRGYLCRSCNTSEGLSDGAGFVKYRKRYPALICGYQAYYFDPITKRFARPREGEVLA